MGADYLKPQILEKMKHQTRQKLTKDMQNARRRMQRETPGSDQWWVAYYDLRKAESLAN